MADRPKLTPREQLVLELLAAGYSTPRIAAELQVSAETVKTWRGNLHRKLGACSAANAVHLAHEAGLLGGDR